MKLSISKEQRIFNERHNIQQKRGINRGEPKAKEEKNTWRCFGKLVFSSNENILFQGLPNMKEAISEKDYGCCNYCAILST